MQPQPYRFARITLFLALLNAASSGYAQEDTYPIKFKVGIVEGWRISPEAVIKWCEKTAPEGITRRQTAYQGWQTKNADIIAHIDHNFDTIVPIITPAANPTVDILRVVRTHLFIEAAKDVFIGKSDDEVKAICTNYSPEDEQNKKLTIVQDALTGLDLWKKQHNEKK